jgi:hypothetical protein
MTERERLQKEILTLTEIIRASQAALRSRTMMTARKDALRQAIAQRKAKLAALKEELAALGNS